MLLCNEFEDPNLESINKTEDTDSRIETIKKLIDECDKEYKSIQIDD